MEKDNWIENIINSTIGMIAVTPSDDLYTKIQKKINKQNKVPLKKVWLIAASIALLVTINFVTIKSKTRENKSASTEYLENTLNKSNQLY